MLRDAHRSLNPLQLYLDHVMKLLECHSHFRHTEVSEPFLILKNSELSLSGY